MKIQLDIPKQIHKQLMLYKVKKEFTTLAEAVINILSDHLNKKEVKK